MQEMIAERQTEQTRPAAPIFRTGSNIIAVASGKGGVGKTWFSITLSHALAKAGKKVLLLDGDLALANVDIQLGVMPKRDLNDVVRGRMGLDKIIHRYEEGGFDIIAGRSGHALLSSLPAQHLTLLRDQLLEVAENYDAVIIDLGAGIRLHAKLGSPVQKGSLLATLYANDATKLANGLASIASAFAIQQAPPTLPPLILGKLTA